MPHTHTLHHLHHMASPVRGYDYNYTLRTSEYTMYIHCVLSPSCLSPLSLQSCPLPPSPSDSRLCLQQSGLVAMGSSCCVSNGSQLHNGSPSQIPELRHSDGRPLDHLSPTRDPLRNQRQRASAGDRGVNGDIAGLHHVGSRSRRPDGGDAERLDGLGGRGDGWGASAAVLLNDGAHCHLVNHVTPGLDGGVWDGGGLSRLHDRVGHVTPARLQHSGVASVNG